MNANNTNTTTNTTSNTTTSSTNTTATNTTTNTTNAMDNLVTSINILAKSVDSLAVNVQSLVDIITNNPAGTPAGTPASTSTGTPATTNLATVGEHPRYYMVFHVQAPMFMNERIRRHIYVAPQLSSSTPPRLSSFTGWKFETMGEMISVFLDRLCPHPFVSNGKSKIRHIGWVRWDQFDAIRQTCFEVPLPALDQPDQCCHQWTEAVITALRTARVLEPLRVSDNPETVFGPDATEDYTF